jgi:hypothetical protein
MEEGSSSATLCSKRSKNACNCQTYSVGLHQEKRVLQLLGSVHSASLFLISYLFGPLGTCFALFNQM